MAATGTPTPNIGLRIPLGTDPASVDDINYNSNILDTKLGAVGSDSVQDQIDTLNGNIVSLSEKIGSFVNIGTIAAPGTSNEAKVRAVIDRVVTSWYTPFVGVATASGATCVIGYVYETKDYGGGMYFSAANIGKWTLSNNVLTLTNI